MSLLEIFWEKISHCMGVAGVPVSPWSCSVPSQSSLAAGDAGMTLGCLSCASDSSTFLSSGRPRGTESQTPPRCLSANAHLITQQPGVAEARAAGELRFSSNRFPSPAQEPEEKPFSYHQINRQVVLPCPSPSPALLSPLGPGMLCKARVGLVSVPGGFCTLSPIPAAVCPTHVGNG